jgi:hypothetical protein
MKTFTSAGGTTFLKWMLKPWPHARYLPFVSAGWMSRS